MAESSSTGAAVPLEDDEHEYESDPDEALLPSAMRRREASDDEDGVEESDAEGEAVRVSRRTGRIASEEESDGQGGAPGYDNEEDSGREEYAEECAEDDDEESVEDVDDQNHVVEKEDQRENAQEEVAEKKVNEPFAVPTAGAFYMHDDRFRNSRGGRRG